MDRLIHRSAWKVKPAARSFLSKLPCRDLDCQRFCTLRLSIKGRPGRHRSNHSDPTAHQCQGAGQDHPCANTTALRKLLHRSAGTRVVLHQQDVKAISEDGANGERTVDAPEARVASGTARASNLRGSIGLSPNRPKGLFSPSGWFPSRIPGWAGGVVWIKDGTTSENAVGRNFNIAERSQGKLRHAVRGDYPRLCASHSRAKSTARR